MIYIYFYQPAIGVPGTPHLETPPWPVPQATLGILQVTVAERPLYAELKMGGEAQSTSCVTGRQGGSGEIRCWGDKQLPFDVDTIGK